MLLTSMIFLTSNKKISNKNILSINAIYICYIMYSFYKYIKKTDNICTSTNEKGHLKWKWINNFNYNIYHIIYIINLVNYYQNKNLIISFIISYLMLILNVFNFKSNVGEFWCLMAPSVPLFILSLQKIFNINN